MLTTIFSLFLSVLSIFVTMIILGIRIIRENETGVVVRLGKPKKVISSGLRFTIWPFDAVRRFTTNIIELEFREATIITAKSKDFGAANVKVKPTMYFRWPETNTGLINALKVVGNPENVEALKNLFEETVLDAFRSVGGSLTWRELAQDRKKFAQTVAEELINEDADPVKQACLENVRLVIINLELPEALRNAITEPEIARMRKEATIEEADGIKQKIIREGEGHADARKKLFEAIGKEPDGVQKEMLLTLREMAKGTSNTILFGIPSQITDAMGNIFGGKDIGFDNIRKIFPGLTDDQIIKAIQKMINKAGGKP